MGFDSLEDVVGYLHAVAFPKMQLTMADEGEPGYHDPIMRSAYEILIEFYHRYLKKITICGRSTRWWDAELTG